MDRMNEFKRLCFDDISIICNTYVIPAFGTRTYQGVGDD